MIKLILQIVSFSLILTRLFFAQAGERNFGVSLNINYTSTSNLFLQPKAIDPFIRNTHENLNRITSYSFEVRYRLLESVIIGVGSELLEKKNASSMNLAGTRISMDDGYQMIPLEVSGYYLIPFSTEHFKFFFGGGFGLYFGKHIRTLGDVTSSTETSKIGYGIHVAFGMDYVIYDFLSVRGQMRFRDPEFEMTSKYSSQTVNYNDATYSLTSQTFNSKVNIDGITFTLGAVFNF